MSGVPGGPGGFERIKRSDARGAAALRASLFILQKQEYEKYKKFFKGVPEIEKW